MKGPDIGCIADIQVDQPFVYQVGNRVTGVFADMLADELNPQRLLFRLVNEFMLLRGFCELLINSYASLRPLSA